MLVTARNGRSVERPKLAWQHGDRRLWAGLLCRVFKVMEHKYPYKMKTFVEFQGRPHTLWFVARALAMSQTDDSEVESSNVTQGTSRPIKQRGKGKAVTERRLG